MKKKNLDTSEFDSPSTKNEEVRLFIVEDNARHLNLLKIKLDLLSYPIVGTTNSTKNALQKIKSCQPNVILLDVNLETNGDGIQLARRIRAFSDIPIIFITAQGDDETIKDAISINPTGYIAKPVNPVDLKANIELAMLNNEVKVQEQQRDFFTVRKGERLQLLRFEEIQLLIVEVKNYVTLVDNTGKRFVVRDSLRNLINSVLPNYFMRTHRSFVVNMNYISFINEKEQMLYLMASDTAPIGKSFRKEVYQKMNIRH